MSLIVLLVVHVLPVLGVITANCGNPVYQAAADPSEQYGYNLCNATTETPNSLCQTGFINGVDDFCLWGPAQPTDQGPLSDTQLERTVAFCTQPGHGTRVIPVNVFYWLSYVKTPSYIEVYGLFDGSVHMSPINYLYTGSQDLVAQLDPRGVDGRGNPIGGIMYSNAFSSSDGQYIQAVEWFSLIGEDFFYLRVCDPNISGSAAYCQRWNNTYYSWVDAAFHAALPEGSTDTLVLPDIYQECLGDSTPLGLVIDQSGSTVMYTGQPLLPTPIIYPPATTSSCTTYFHSQLFQSIPTSIAPGAKACTSTLTPNTASIALSHPMSDSTPIHSSTKTAGNRAGAIIGATIGVLVLVCLLIAFSILRKRRRRNSNNDNADSPKINMRLLTLDAQDGALMR